MTNALLAVIVVTIILFCSEYLWRKKMLKGEYSRKLIHILAGCFVASMPFWISYGWIVIFALSAILLSLINHQHRFLKAGLSVSRRSYGDLLFAVSILICAAIQPNKWIFMVAILHVSLADGLAAVIGTPFLRQKDLVYKVFGQKKTIVGSAVFVAVSFLLLFLTVELSGAYDGISSIWPVLIWLPIATAITESVGVFGADNLLLPILVMFALLAVKTF